MADNEVSMMLSVLPGAMTGFATLTAGLASINNIFMQTMTRVDDNFGIIDSSIIATGALVAQLGMNAMNAYGQMEQGMKIVQMVSGQTAADIDYLSQKANQFSVQYRTDIDQITEGLQTLGRAGLNTAAEQAEVLENGLTTAKLEGRELNSVLEELIQNTALLGGDLKSNNFGEDSQYVNDLLVATSMTAPITTHDVSETLKYSGGIAAAAGANIETTEGKAILEDYMGTVAAFAQKGVTGSIAGTALRAFLNKPATQDDSVKEALGMLKLKPEYLWEDGEETMKPISQQIALIQNQMDKLDISTMDRLQIWSKIVGGKMGQQMMKLDSSDIKDITKDIQNARSAEDLAAGSMKTFEANVKATQESMAKLERNLGEILVKIANPPMEFFNKILGFLNNDFAAIPIAVTFVGFMGAVINRIRKVFSTLKSEIREVWSALKGGDMVTVRQMRGSTRSGKRAPLGSLTVEGAQTPDDIKKAFEQKFAVDAMGNYKGWKAIDIAVAEQTKGWTAMEEKFEETGKMYGFSARHSDMINSLLQNDRISDEVKEILARKGNKSAKMGTLLESKQTVEQYIIDQYENLMRELYPDYDALAKKIESSKSSTKSKKTDSEYLEEKHGVKQEEGDRPKTFIEALRAKQEEVKAKQEEIKAKQEEVKEQKETTVETEKVSEEIEKNTLCLREIRQANRDFEAALNHQNKIAADNVIANILAEEAAAQAEEKIINDAVAYQEPYVDAGGSSHMGYGAPKTNIRVMGPTTSISPSTTSLISFEDMEKEVQLAAIQPFLNYYDQNFSRKSGNQAFYWSSQSLGAQVDPTRYIYSHPEFAEAFMQGIMPDFTFNDFKDILVSSKGTIPKAKMKMAYETYMKHLRNSLDDFTLEQIKNRDLSSLSAAELHKYAPALSGGYVKGWRGRKGRTAEDVRTELGVYNALQGMHPSTMKKMLKEYGVDVGTGKGLTHEKGMEQLFPLMVEDMKEHGSYLTERIKLQNEEIKHRKELVKQLRQQVKDEEKMRNERFKAHQESVKGTFKTKEEKEKERDEKTRENSVQSAYVNASEIKEKESQYLEDQFEKEYKQHYESSMAEQERLQKDALANQEIQEKKRRLAQQLQETVENENRMRDEAFQAHLDRVAAEKEAAAAKKEAAHQEEIERAKEIGRSAAKAHNDKVEAEERRNRLNRLSNQPPVVSGMPPEMARIISEGGGVEDHEAKMKDIKMAMRGIDPTTGSPFGSGDYMKTSMMVGLSQQIKDSFSGIKEEIKGAASGAWASAKGRWTANRANRFNFGVKEVNGQMESVTKGLRGLGNGLLNMTDLIGGPIMAGMMAFSFLVEYYNGCKEEFTKSVQEATDQLNEMNQKVGEAEDIFFQGRDEEGLPKITGWNDEHPDATAEEREDALLGAYESIYDNNGELSALDANTQQLAIATAELRKANEGVVRNYLEDKNFGPNGRFGQIGEGIFKDMSELNANFQAIQGLADDNAIQKLSDFLGIADSSYVDKHGTRRDFFGSSYLDTGEVHLDDWQKSEDFPWSTEFAPILASDIWKTGSGTDGLKVMLGDSGYAALSDQLSSTRKSSFGNQSSSNRVGSVDPWESSAWNRHAQNLGAEFQSNENQNKLQMALKNFGSDFSKLAKQTRRFEKATGKTALGSLQNEIKKTGNIRKALKNLQVTDPKLVSYIKSLQIKTGMTEQQVLMAAQLQQLQDMQEIANTQITPRMESVVGLAAEQISYSGNILTETGGSGAGAISAADNAAAIALLLNAKMEQTLWERDYQQWVKDHPGEEDPYGDAIHFAAQAEADHKTGGELDKYYADWAKMYAASNFMMYNPDLSAVDAAKRAEDWWTGANSATTGAIADTLRKGGVGALQKSIQDAYDASLDAEEGDSSGSGSGSGSGDKDKSSGTKKERVDLVLCSKKEIPKLNVNLFKKPPSFTILNKNFKLRDVKINSEDKPKAVMAAIKNSFIDIQKRTDPKIIQDEDAIYDPNAATDGTNLPSGSAKTRTD